MGLLDALLGNASEVDVEAVALDRPNYRRP